jgi:hypothetical protein
MCDPGFYCKPGTQGNEPYYDGFFDNHTYHCDVGTYCKGGQTQNLPMAPINFENTVTECLRGFICPQGSTLTNGNGACPSGYYCPHRNSTNVICPLRHYCPDRANIEPTPCPKGTYNMWFGQKNCTICPLGRVCPLTGMLVPLPCPPGYICNKEGLVTPDNLCRIGSICLGNVKSGLKQSERACYINNNVSAVSLCEGTVYDISNNTDLLLSQPYFNNRSVCCKNASAIGTWIKSLGVALGEPEIFKTYAQVFESQTKVILNRLLLEETVPKYDGSLLLNKALNNLNIGQAEQIKFTSPRHEHMMKLYI